MVLCATLAVCTAAAANETEQAVKQLRKAVKADPSNAEPHYKLAQALSEQGRFELGRGGRRMADPVFEEAIAEYTKTVELQPSNTDARKSLVSELEFMGKFAEARAQLREIVKLNSGDASAHLELARADLRQDGGDLNEALAEFHAALGIKPQNAGAWSDLGEALGRAGKYQDAASAYGEAVKLSPKDDTARFNLGEALRHAGKVDEAVEQYREAIRLNPQWKDMLSTNLAGDLAAKDAGLARRDVEILQKLGYPVDPQILHQLQALDAQPSK
jgi:tetratricopeptide (TPR) repeat protein